MIGFSLVRVPLTLFVTLLVAACASFPENQKTTGIPNNEGYRFNALAKDNNTDSLLVIVTFSGGGTRAAALSFGVLNELANTKIRWKGQEKSLLGPEFVAQAVRDWIKAVGAQTEFIEPGSPWENGYCESFNGRFRDELLNGALIVIEQWRKHYNTKRPHSALGYRPPAPETIIPMDRTPSMN